MTPVPDFVSRSICVDEVEAHKIVMPQPVREPVSRAALSETVSVHVPAGLSPFTVLSKPAGLKLPLMAVPDWLHCPDTDCAAWSSRTTSILSP